jgi:hypothetical protein
MVRPLAVLAGFRTRLKHGELDDRNHWWKEKFGAYSDLAPETRGTPSRPPPDNSSQCWTARASAYSIVSFRAKRWRNPNCTLERSP